MDDKLKVFWNLDVLVKMCRSKSDGPSLRIEEVEIVEKIKAYKQEIEEITIQTEEESYDTSAEMADRNIEIITKKQLQTLKSDLKEKNKQLNILKEEEQTLYKNNTLLRETKTSQEKYILSMQERVSEATNYEIIDRYNALIAETTEKVAKLSDELEEQAEQYEKVQEEIVQLTNEISELEEKIDKKKKLLAETQTNLENKENYIDKTKKEKNNKKIAELESKIEKLSKRLEELRKDPKYLESRIKDVINNKENTENAKGFLIDLINIVIKQPYINVPADNSLEEELLKATQARDSFANEIDQKSYNILEADTPEKLRIEFLTERISKWQDELKRIKIQVDQVDKDQEYGYERKNQQLYNMINTMKLDLKEFQKAYDETPESSISYKASLKAQLDEKKEDIIEAEKIATAFRKDESEDIAKATRAMKYECEQISQNISNAEEEIAEIKNRLTTKKSGLIDITSKNKDKETLKELAQIVIDIKHRRQFPETPLEIIQRLEELLGIELMKEIDNNVIENNSNIVTKDYDEYTNFGPEVPVGIKVDTDLSPTEPAPKRGIKVINEATISNPLDSTDKENDEEEYDDIQNPFGIENEPETIEELRPTENQEATTNIEVPVSEDNEETSESTSTNSLEKESVMIEESIETTDEVALSSDSNETEIEVETEPTIEEEIVTEETTEETPVEETKIELSSEEIEDAKIEEEIDMIIDNLKNDVASSNDSEDEDTPLDIGALINPTVEEPEQQLENANDLSITSMFNNTNDENNDNIVTSEDLTNELDKFINDLGKDEA